MPPGSAAPKRRNINPEVARERARKGAYASHTPASHLRALARAAERGELTADEKDALAALAALAAGDGAAA